MTHILESLNAIAPTLFAFWIGASMAYFLFEGARQERRADRAEKELNELKQTIIDLFPPDNAITKELKDNNLI